LLDVWRDGIDVVGVQVPSLSFAPSHLLSVMAVGCVTGLVVDCGHLETTVLPVSWLRYPVEMFTDDWAQIYAARPLYPYLVSTPVAGSRLNRRLRALLLRYASFVPPPSSLNSTSTPIITKVPAGLLSEAMIEEIKTRLCFVGDALPPSDDLSDLLNDDMETDDDPTGEQALLRRMERRYASRVTATTITFKVPSLHLPPVLSGVGRGWIQVPGWVRERAAEVLFEEGDEDARSVTEVILESLLRVRPILLMIHLY
jgi:actin-related protein 10